MIRLRILGARDLRAADGNEILSVSAQPKRVALLAYVTLSSLDGGVARDTLLAMLWPELDQEHARNNLNQQIHHLRQSLGPDTITSSNGGDLVTDRSLLWCDAVEFDEAIRAQEYEHALDLYRGDFLQGFHVSGVLEFERWLDRRRAEYADQAAEAAIALGCQAEKAGDSKLSVVWFRRARTIKPESELAVRGLVSALANTGDPTGALEVFRGFEVWLEKEFGAQAGAETRALIESVQRQAAQSFDSIVGDQRDAHVEAESVWAAPGSVARPIGRVTRRTRNVLGAAGVVALLAGAWYVRNWPPATAEAGLEAGVVSDVRLAYADLADDPRPSIAVLPFADLSPEGNQEYFSDGVTEEIVNGLAQIRELRVSARTSTFALKDRDLTAVQWGDTLRVRYLVEGSVRRAGSQVRITAQLIDTSDGSHLWSKSYDRALDNIFAIQTEIAQALADALMVPLGLNDAPDLVTPAADIEAYDLYLEGRARLRERGEGTLAAIDLFKAAVARDSSWAPAWAGLAAATGNSVWWVGNDSASFIQTLGKAEEAARRSLDLNPQNPVALVSLGSIHRDRHEWAEAEAAYRRALDLDPDNAEAHQQYAEWLHKRGRVAEAVRSIDRAVALDPAPIRILQLAIILRRDGRWDEVEEVLEWAVARGLDEQLPFLRRKIESTPNARAYSEGRYEDVVLLETPETPGDTVGRGEMLRALSAGRLDLVPDTMRDKLSAKSLVRLNEPELAVARFLSFWESERASPLYPDVVWSWGFDPIRSHERFQAYMASLGLGGLTVHRTPVEERVRPAILRMADTDEAPGESAP